MQRVNPCVITIALLLIVFLGAGVSHGQARAGSITPTRDNQPRYRVMIDGNLAEVRVQKEEFNNREGAIFDRNPSTGRWERLEPGSEKSSAAPLNWSFGYAVAVDGDYAIVGVEWHGGFKGAAYIFKRSGAGWGEPAMLWPPDLGRFDHFGGSVAISGDYAVVGATWHNLLQGAVYIFKRVGEEWIQQQKLVPRDATSDGQFGRAVRIGEDEIVISSASTDSEDAGANLAHRFRHIDDIWTEQQKIDISNSSVVSEGSEDYGLDASTSGDLFRLVELVEEETQSPPPLPSALQLLDPVDTVVASDGVYEDRVEIVWSSVGLNAIIYRILRDGTLLSIMSSEDSLYVDVTGTPGEVYNYCVIVQDMSGPESAATCDDGSRIIFAPEQVLASDGDFDEFVRVTWTDMSSVEAGYLIKRDNDPIGTTPANGNVFEDITASVASPYLYEVVAYDADGYQSQAVGDLGYMGHILPPLAVSASDGEYPDRVVITWIDQAENEEGYNIYWKGLFVGWTGPDAVSYEYWGAMSGETSVYCVATRKDATTESVRACDEGGVGILPAPENVEASDGTYDDHIEITWDPVSDLVDSLKIVRYSDTLATLTADLTIYEDFTVGWGYQCQYCVIAVNNNGGRSAPACDQGFKSQVLAPYDVEATDGEYEDRVNITWKTNSTTTALFEIFRGDTFIKSVGADGRSYSDYGGTAGQEYEYSIMAMNALDSGWATGSDTGYRELLAPTAVTASDDEYEDRIEITWADNSLVEDGYIVYREDLSKAVAVPIDTLNRNSTWSTDTAAVPGVTYLYSVAAFDTLGVAGGESETNADEGRRILPAPTAVMASDGEFENRVEITWMDNSNAEEGYRIYRDGLLIGSTVDNSTAYTDNSPVLGSMSEYGVAAYDNYGESDPGYDMGYTAILAPLSFNASDKYEDRIELTWVDASEVETGFEILRDGATIGSTPPDATLFTDISTNQGWAHEYCIRAFRDIDGNPTYVGTYETSANCITVRGNYAYVAVGGYYGGFEILDISDPGSPEYVGSCDTPGDARGVDVNGDYAYIADYTSGLTVVDVSNPANPTFVGNYLTPHSAVNVVVSGNYAYVAAVEAGLQVIDISDPQNPDFAGSYETPNFAQNVAISGDYAYVADQAGGLQVIDISDPPNPVYAGDYSTPGTAWGVTIRGDYAFVADLHRGLIVLDISDPANIDSVGSYDTPGYSWNVALRGDYAYVADGYAGLQVIDISDVANPIYKGGYDTPGWAGGVALCYDFAYVADGDFVVLRIRSSSETVCDEGSRLLLADIPRIELDLELLASDGEDDDRFGFSVAVSEDIAIVGAVTADTEKGLHAGAAYIFERVSTGVWTEDTILVASDIAALDWFGCAVAISGDVAVVGAPDKNSNTGAAYVFTRGANGTWSEKKKLTASDGKANAYFGGSVAISGNKILIGAYGDNNENGEKAGAAYIFTSDASGNWSESQKLIGDSPGYDDWFGWSVGINGDNAVVGAVKDDSCAANAGAAYFFEGDPSGQWVRTGKVVASDGTAWGDFGRSVAIDGQIAVVGADVGNGVTEMSGSAYIFTRQPSGGWIESHKLTASDGAEFDYFGSSVAISGGKIVVGALGDDDNGGSSGSAYVFVVNLSGDWIETAKLLASDGAQNSFFGISVATDGLSAFFGASGHHVGGASPGAAYACEFVTPPAMVAVSDGSLNSRVRVQWEDRSSNEGGFNIYRDDELIAATAPDIEVYEDFEAQPGRTGEYCVAAFNSSWGESDHVCDFGWRPPNGNITGRVSTISGAGVEDISVDLDPKPFGALLFDGSGGRVTVPASDGPFDFDASMSYTVELWVKYTGSGGTGFWNGTIIAKGGWPSHPFSLSNRRKEGRPGRLCFEFRDADTAIKVPSVQDNLNDGVWHHVACVHDADQDELRIYVDGALEGTTGYASMGDITNDDNLTIGAGRDADTWFGGQVDEIRIWNVARTLPEIQATMKKPLTGGEAGLVGYWPLDGGDGEAITDLTAGTHYGTFEGGIYWTGDIAPLETFASTDVEGNYVLDNIRYGEETTFKVRPFMGQRQFSPAFKTITLSTGNPVENQVNFIDVSSFTVTGTVVLSVPACPATNVEIHVGDQLRAVTDKNGKYAVAVGMGKHVIKPVLAGHAFSPDTLPVQVTGDTSGINFADTTMRELSVIAGGGGCRLPIGNLTIKYRSTNNCMKDSITIETAITTVYRKSLPPQKYFVSAVVDMGSVPTGLDPVHVSRFFENLGEREVDLTDSAASIDFIYRAPLQVKIKDLEDYKTCGQLTYPGRTLPASLAVIPQLDTFTLTIEVGECYSRSEQGCENLCLLDSGTVIIYDEWADHEDSLVELVVRNGQAKYTTFGCTPSLIVGRVDSDGNDRSFQKALQATVFTDGRARATVTEWAIVTGRVKPEGKKFITATALEFPTYILRDPPGDNSYAFIEEGRSLRTTIEYGKVTVTASTGLEVKCWLGSSQEFFFGIGAGTIQKAEVKTCFETRLMAGVMVNDEDKTEITITTKERFSTSADDLFVGERGDVFIGSGVNYTFSEVGVVSIENCEIIRSTSVAFEPEGFETLFAYTQHHIKEILIPELASKKDHFLSLYESTSDPAYFRTYCLLETNWKNWTAMLENSNSLKQAAETIENRSFSAGAEYSYFLDSAITRSYSTTHTFVGDWTGLGGGWGFETSFGGVALAIPWSVHTEGVLGIKEGVGDTSVTVGYVFSDGDIGDYFSVDIKEDGRYPSWVFDVPAGVSSCPYEPWLDADSNAQMTPRDGPQLAMGGGDLTGVPPDEPAGFTLNLANLSLTGETREYILREVTTANPGGAIMKVDGAPLAGGVSYYINGGSNNNSQEVTLTVERGPTRYKYPNLAVMLYPPCEYSVWEKGGPLQRADTLWFTVEFDHPCSDITLYHVEPEWQYTRHDSTAHDSLTLSLTDFEWRVSETDTIQEIGAQYRRLGSGQEASAEWARIPYDVELDSTTTTVMINWFPFQDATLVDGFYELRGYTKCSQGKGYSNIWKGVIDLNPPQVFGKPEPADSQLSLGENISITFNETIDCQSVKPNNLLILRDIDADSTIPIKTVCNGRTVMISPAAESASLEGRWLEACVSGIADAVGNTMEGEARWRFEVRQSAFAWSQRGVSGDIAYGTAGSITAELVNGSSSPAAFTIDALTIPDWIDSVVPDAGIIAVGCKEKITFFARDDLQIDSYDGSQILATSNCGDAFLSISLEVSCHEPVWSFNREAYQYTMTVVARVKDAADTYLADSLDQVAAFVGNQLRGVANLEPGVGGNRMLFLTVYSNRVGGETIRFQVWDNNACKLYNSTSERIRFASDGIIGSPYDPFILTAVDVLPDTVQVIPFSQGWNWFSTNILALDMSANGVLSYLTPAEGDIIKSQSELAVFDPDTGWVGTLQNLDNVSGYMIRLSEPGSIFQEGSVVPDSLAVVPVDNGWNWIGYTPTWPIEVSTALQDLNLYLSNGDLVKSQNAFMQYKGPAQAGWYGDLGFMNPGQGYKLYLQKAPANKGFEYLPSGGSNPPKFGSDVVAKAESSEMKPGWSVNHHTYQYNLTVIAALKIKGSECRNENTVIGAFIDGECRGVSRPIYVSSIDRYLTFLTIHGNESTGKSTTFQIFVPEEGAVYDVEQTLAYEADAIFGTLRAPSVLNANRIAYEIPGSLPTTYDVYQNYPNPFNPMTTIRYDLPVPCDVNLIVYNILGQKVRTLVSGYAEAGRHEAVWDGRDENGRPVATGVYLYRLVSGDFNRTKKMVLIK